MNLLVRMMNNIHGKDDLKLYNKLFGVNDSYLSNKLDIYVDYYSADSSMEEIERNYSRLMELSTQNKESKWYDYYARGNL
jgi:hypothetical protein